MCGGVTPAEATPGNSRDPTLAPGNGMDPTPVSARELVEAPALGIDMDNSPRNPPAFTSAVDEVACSF